MGLDMYLYAEKYISQSNLSKEDAFKKNPMYLELVDYLDNLREVVDNEAGGFVINIPVGYWRKFNALHGYIVENFADGVDNCQDISLNRIDLEIILEVLSEIKQDPSKAMELMPPTQGFFFGGYEIDDWYMAQLDYTILTFKNLLSKSELNYFVYKASW